MHVVVIAVLLLALFGGWLWAEARGGKLLRISLGLACMLALGGIFYALNYEAKREYDFRLSLRSFPPGKDESATIQKHLAALRERRVWSGDRWTHEFRGSAPATSGPWQIEIVPTEKEGVIELRGISVGEERSVQLDLTRGLLFIDGEEFFGYAVFAGSYPGLGGVRYWGAHFERPQGSLFGRALIGVLEDGRVFLNFRWVTANGVFPKNGDWGVLSPAKQAD